MYKISRILALTTISLSLLNLIGWSIGNKNLETIFMENTMMPSAAVSFLLSAIAAWLISKKPLKDIHFFTIVLFNMFIFILMFALLIQALSGSDWGLGNMFFFTDDRTKAQLIPSLATVLAFSLSPVFFLLELAINGSGKVNIVNGLLLFAIGLSCLLGYYVDSKAMYFFNVDKSNPMALSTGILFILLGLSLITGKVGLLKFNK